MIPIKLHFKGLYSYQKEQVVEFNELLNAQIFGIFGAVGSGKSSILDAITYALYGQTERLNKGDNRNYNMMNLKSNELLIDFWFSNFEGKEFRFVVKGKRHGKDFEKVPSFDRTAYTMQGEEWLPVEVKDVDSIVGLSYDNFRRTIIIPQGRFQEFLQLGNADRTRMLKEIFQLEKYEFFYQTRNLENKNNASLDHLRGQLSTYAEVLEEKIIQTAEYLRITAEKINEKKQELQSGKDTLQKEQQLKERVEAIQKYQQDYQLLVERKAEMDHLGRLLEKKSYCLQHFKSGLDRKGEWQQLVKQSILAKKEESQRFDEIQNKLTQLDSALQVAKEEFAQQEANKEKLQDYEYLIQLVRLHEKIGTNTQRTEKGTQVVQQVSASLTEAEATAQAFQLEIQQKSKEIPDSRELIALQSWYEQRKTKTLAVENLRKEQEILLQEETEGQNTFQKFVQNHQTEFPLKEFSLERLKEEIEQGKRIIEKEQRLTLDRLTHLTMQMRLGEFTEAIKRGEACPLCGSLEHGPILEVENVALEIESLQKKEEQLKLQLISIAKVESEFQSFLTHQTLIQRQKAQVQQKAEEQQRELEAHLQTFNWPDFHPEEPEKLRKVLKFIQDQNEYINQLYLKQEEHEGTLKKLRSEYQTYSQSLEQIKQKLNTDKATFNTYLLQLKQHELSDVDRFSEEVLGRHYQELKEQIEKIKDRYERLIREEAAFKEKLVSHGARLKELTATHLTQQQTLDLIQAELEKSLAQSDFNNWSEVEEILKDPSLTESVRQELNQYKQQLFLLEEKIKELQTEQGDQQFDPDAHENLVLAVQRMESELEVLNTDYLGEKQNYNRQLLQLKEKEKLLLELEVLTRREQNLKTMRQLFTGNGFVNFISTVYLKNLCQVANKRFYPLTNQQLRLELGESNEFLIRDFLNDGRLRSVKTLSGGQTFQASLCLALALAESVQLQNQSKQNFFFLDEGFGSLDKDALQMAFDTLKALRKENRIVGIISHVEDLQQEIDVYLKVANDPISGSSIQKGSPLNG